MDAWNPPVLLFMEDQWRAVAKNAFFIIVFSEIFSAGWK